MTPDQIDNRLAYLGKAAVPVCRAAVNAGAKELSARIQSAAPVGKKWRKVNGQMVAPGAMKRSINFRVTSKNKVISAKAGLDVGKRKDADKNRGGHGHLFVEGTDERYTGFSRVRVKGKTVDLKRTKSTIRYRGRAPAHSPSFIKTASASAESTVWQVVIDKLSKGIEKAAVRQG